MEKSPDAFRTISEVAQDLALPQHVLRFWETRFTQIKPLKRGGGRRYYRPDDIELLRSIRHLLYADGYTIKGVQRLLREHGARAVTAAATGGRTKPADDVRDADFQSNDMNEASPPPQAAPSGLEALFGGAAPPKIPQVASGSSVSTFDRTKLQAVLADLAECERLLAAARSL